MTWPNWHDKSYRRNESRSRHIDQEGKITEDLAGLCGEIQEMSHGEKLPRINAKLSYVERERPKWYRRDEQILGVYEHNLDDQIKKIDSHKPESRERKRRFELPRGISAAEHGR